MIEIDIYRAEDLVSKSKCKLEENKVKCGKESCQEVILADSDCLS